MTPPGLWTRAAARLVRFAEWVFSPQAPAIDLGLMLCAAGWAILEVMRPEIFDRGAFVGLGWVSDPVWFALHVVLTVLHGIGLVRLHGRTLRAGAAFLSAWHWLFVAASLFPIVLWVYVALTLAWELEQKAPRIRRAPHEDDEATGVILNRTRRAARPDIADPDAYFRGPSAWRAPDDDRRGH